MDAFPRLIGGSASQPSLILLAGFLGAISGTSVYCYALLYFVPIAWAWSRSRAGASLTMFIYYLAVNWLIVPSWYGFYDEDINQVPVGVAVWITLSALNTIPWLLLWRENDRWLFVRLVAVALLGVLPPWGFVHVAYPFLSTAFIAPASGVVGLIGGVWLLAQIVRRPFLIIIPVALFIWTTHPYENYGAPSGWVGSDTRVTSSHPGLDLKMSFRAMSSAAIALARDEAKVLVLPESIGGLTSSAAAPIFDRLRDRTIVAGGLRTLPDRGYEAVLFEYSNEHRAGRNLYTQRVPVPIVSKLWPDLSRPNAVTIANRRVGPLICFEAFVPWPVLASIISNADTLVVSSNFAWTSFGMPIATVQEATVLAWARLFNVHTVFATNWRPKDG